MSSLMASVSSRWQTTSKVPERRRTNLARGTQNAVETVDSTPGSIPLRPGIVMCSDVSLSVIMSQQAVFVQKLGQRCLQHNVDILCNSFRNHRSPCSPAT